jgi:RecB family nuclease, putative, TM0106 family
MQSANGTILLSPSDLSEHVNCRHLTTLAREVARGERVAPHVADEATRLLRQKGELHERQFMDHLRATGRDVIGIPTDPYWDFHAAAVRTIDAMRAGVDVISQATFVDGPWRGRADFLMKVAGESRLGPWRYEALDAKLARAEKPTYVLQLCFYSDGIASIQGDRPENMHVVLGIGEQRSLRYDDFAAYYRRVRSRFESTESAPVPTEGYPVDHCSLCDFRGVCEQHWKDEDHLALVAGMRRVQVARLRNSDLPTLTALGEAAPGTQIKHVAPHSFETLRDQAALQLKARLTGRVEWHVIEAERGHGWELLPETSPGDIIFDIEGDPFWEPARGLHFLFGVLSRQGTEWKYRPMWAHDRAGERRMFESFIDLVRDRLVDYPRMHVYHYGTYENAAIKELMGIYATRENEVDQLLRTHIFVNLHTVVRQGLRAGVDSYSLKKIEALAAFQRRADVKRGMDAVLTYEKWMTAPHEALLTSISDYNEEDCRATLAVREWLVAQHPVEKAWAQAIVPIEHDDEAADERNALRQRLLVSAQPGSPRWLAAELLEYHQREARPAYWWHFTRRDQMSNDDLIDDGEAIGGLSVMGDEVKDKRSFIYTLSFPVQQHKLAAGDQVVDPQTKELAGQIVSVDDTASTLQLRRGPKLRDVALPRAIISEGPYRPKPQRSALARLAQSILANDCRYPALWDIVAREPPRLAGRERGSDIQTIDLDAQRELTLALDSSYLFIQGPPGTGKTWTGARLITELIRRGRRVGVAATSHKAIHNLLDEVEKAAAGEGLQFRGLKKSSAENPESPYNSASIGSTDKFDAFTAAGADTLLFAGTAWFFADERLDRQLDTLVIDEAGQVSLADALAVGTCARNVVLLGDPLQLAQVSQGTHPEGTGLSVLEHLLGDHATVPRHMGLFLECTRRMHPDVCRFISEIVYDDRLMGVPELARQETAFGTGLRFVAVDHIGNGAASSEEAAAVATQIGGMVDAMWTDCHCVTRPLRQSDFMVVAPYNAQVRRLREALAKAHLTDVPVGTVDKFQGRQAAIVFYSMATSSIEDVPRSLEFLFSRNRLNVAISRAMCLAIIVASPRLLESQARTIDQMRLVNALCRFVEIADIQATVK